MNSELVIKVKYGDTLRRFNVFVGDNGLNMEGLREKILNLFKFTSDADFTLTYIDEDNDVVTLVNDEDLHDAIGQRLNPLRITVLPNSNRAETFDTRSNVSSTCMRSPRIPSHPFSHMNSGVAEVLGALPEPLCDAFTKLSSDLASKAASYATVPPVPELCDALSKLSIDLASKAVSSAPALTELARLLSNLPPMPHLVPVSNCQDGATSNAQSKDSELVELLSNLPPLPPLFPVSNCQDGATSNAQSKDSDSSMYNKGTKGPRASKDLVGTPEVLSSSKFFDPAPTNNTNVSGSGNKTKAVATSVPPATASKDLGVMLSKGSNEDNFVSLVLASDDNSGKKLQKECVGHPTGKSIAAGTSFPTPNDLLMHLEPQPSQVLEEAMLPIPSIYAYGGSGFVDGDNSKKLSSGVGYSYASHVGFGPHNIGPVGLDSFGTVPSGGSYRVHPFKRSYSHCDSMGRIFHKGVRCDGCGVYPITGPRFKSKAKEDYDLCSICFSEMGNVAEYTRMDRPMSFRSPRSFKEFQDPCLHPRFARPSFPHVLRGSGVKPMRPKLDSCFIQDVNVPDGSLMAPATPFTKIWQMRNNGTIVWPHGTQLVWIGGDQFDRGSVKLEIPLEGFPEEEELDIAVDFIAPEHPGRYISYWRMTTPSGQKFGQCVWVLIQVQVNTTLRDTSSEKFHGLNLNLPPESSRSEVQIIDVNIKPVDSSDHPESHFNMVTELVKPMLDGYPSMDQELNLPLTDSLLDSNGDSVPVLPDVPVAGDSVLAPPDVPEAVSYPLVDFSVVPSEPFLDIDAALAYEEVDGGDDGNMVEQTLLKELDEMGFKQIDLNKEILRINEYNLEQSVEDLCGISEWDPILEELQEMGFCDREMNRRLLRKNGGSIKRVVMDLIAGEKA